MLQKRAKHVKNVTLINEISTNVTLNLFGHSYLVNLIAIKVPIL